MKCRNCQPHVETEFLSRRDFLSRSGAGFGLLGLAGVLSQEAFPYTVVSRGDTSPLAPKAPHFAPKATSCIFLFMYGGPSGIDLFEPKPVLDQMHGQSAPENLMPFFGGGGIKGGVSYGATDEIGWKAVEGRVSVNDLHATILQLMGLDHERLIYSHNGRPFRLTDVAGRLIHPILA